MASWEEAAFIASLKENGVEILEGLLSGISEKLPSGVEPPPRPKLLIVDHFDLSMIDADIVGAVLLIRPISRQEAQHIAREEGATFSVVNVRGLTELERQLGMTTNVHIPKLALGGRMLVMKYVSWNDVRWHVVEYQCDGDGCVG